MNQFVQIKFANGDVFLVPFEVIAEHRTAYYAEKDGYKKDSEEWNTEFKDSMQVSEINDWIGNNMDWEDLEEHAILQPQVDEKFSYRHMWPEAEMETVTK